MVQSVAAIAVIISLLSSTASPGASFSLIEDPAHPDANLHPRDVSSDGRWVGGYIGSGPGARPRAFRFEISPGKFEYITCPDQEELQSYSLETIAAGGSSALLYCGAEPSYWDFGFVPQPLNAAPGAAVRSMSSDGQTFVGSAPRTPGSNESEAFSFRIDTGLVFLGKFPLPATWSRAEYVSQNAAVIAGNAMKLDFGDTQLRSAAFIWSPALGFRELERLPGEKASFVLAMSTNGKHIVASNEGTTSNRIYIWREGGALLEITPKTGDGGYVSKISNDGTIALGEGRIDGTNGPVIWRRGKGWALLQKVAEDEYGLKNAIGNLILRTVYGASSDGLTISGVANTGPFTQSQGYILRLF
ncbi:hypothetical protein [Bradyrhizobium japonicum]|uniref:hypothetical protein n=1 Tax=Bradyrhizobium japonicum TaxID=375 RepID=UPI001269AF1D|nr:hypothetical protein [Bradyrhizobium japonicum]